MTTGRINQVCQMLPRITHSPVETHGSVWLSSKSAMVHIKHNSNAYEEAPPSKMNLQLDASETAPHDRPKRRK